MCAFWIGLTQNGSHKTNSLFRCARSQYRSPEEFIGVPIDEQIDVYSMGNNIYCILTGLVSEKMGVTQRNADLVFQANRSRFLFF